MSSDTSDWQLVQRPTCEDYFARHKDEEHNFWQLHPVDQTREELWLILQQFVSC